MLNVSVMFQLIKVWKQIYNKIKNKSDMILFSAIKFGVNGFKFFWMKIGVIWFQFHDKWMAEVFLKNKEWNCTKRL